MLGRLEKALSAGGGPPIIWLAAANCTGCTVSLANRISTSGPKDVADLLLNTINLPYHPNLMGAAGDLAVSSLRAAEQGSFILAVEGGIPTAIEARRRAHEMGAVFGGRMPLPHTYVPGGFTSVPTNQHIDTFRNQLNWLTDFIANTYISDVQQLAAIYPDFLSIGAGCGNFLAFGAFDLNDGGSQKLFARGTGTVANKRQAARLSPTRITESVTYSWYDDRTNNLKIASGQTLPVHPREKADAYSWLKAPRLANKPQEAGPLARMWVNGDYRNGASVMDRHLARAQEALKVAQAMNGWLDELIPNGPVYTEYTTPSKGTGMGLTEAPRGALGHWVKIIDSKIASYQVITPTCWNASPRDSRSVLGPMEHALVGTPHRGPLTTRRGATRYPLLCPLPLLRRSHHASGRNTHDLPGRQSFLSLLGDGNGRNVIFPRNGADWNGQRKLCPFIFFRQWRVQPYSACFSIAWVGPKTCRSGCYSPASSHTEFRICCRFQTHSFNKS